MKLIHEINGNVEWLDKKIENISCLSGNAIKLIAIFAMLWDHILKIVMQWVINNYWFGLEQAGKMTTEQFIRLDNLIRFDLQKFGVIAFPLFCFLLSEGFYHTKNIRKYISLMLIFALLSEIPFDMGFFARLSALEGTFPLYFHYQNVFFTLTLGLLALLGIEYFTPKSDNTKGVVISHALQFICVLFTAIAAEIIVCDYGMEGVIYPVCFYIARKSKVYQILLFFVAYIFATGNQPPIGILLAGLIILLYNGERGRLKLKYSFYAFYPIHILILYIITLVLERILVI